MRIGLAYGAWALNGRFFDLTNLYGDERGLTGSELAFFEYSHELGMRGHEVSLYLPEPNAEAWKAASVFPIGDLGNHPLDAVVAWHEPDLLRKAPRGALRVVEQQLNDFLYTERGFDAFVDAYTGPSAAHVENITSRGSIEKMEKVIGYDLTNVESTTRSKWHVVPNGCDPSLYPADDSRRVSGLVVYTSSPDRGLHLLLSQWPAIRRAVPHAELEICYHGLHDWIEMHAPIVDRGNAAVREQGARARYIVAALERLEGKHGVTVRGSMSRRGMAELLGRAEVLAYPCDTVYFTEGFSVSVLEGCASGALPVISSADALEEVYGGAVPMVEAPAREHVIEWGEYVAKALTDGAWRCEWVVKARERAAAFTWEMGARKLEGVLLAGKG